MNRTENLDTAELLHLAIEASRRDDHGASIAYLKQAIDLPQGQVASSTDYGKLVYMLGAEYAQIGMMDRAQEHMAQAVDINPELHTARFQLGLLHLTRAEVAQAMSAWAPLEKLGPESCLYHFQQGMTSLVRDDVRACRQHLAEGMAVNSRSADFNEALNHDMQKLLNALPTEDGQDAAQAASQVEAGFIMSAYHKPN